MTSSSKLLNDTLGRWVSNEPMEKRALFIDILFDLFKEAGVTKASELGKNRIKTSVAMVNALRKLPADDRMEFLGILKDLAKSGGDALKRQRQGIIPGRSWLEKPWKSVIAMCLQVSILEALIFPFLLPDSRICVLPAVVISIISQISQMIKGRDRLLQVL